MGLPFKIKRVNIPAVRTINRTIIQNNESADEIEEYDTLADFPVEGESDILYLDLDTKIYYIWTGASYETQVVLALGETSTTAFRGDQGKTAYDHSQTTHNANFVGLGNVSNVAQLPLSYLDTDTALAANSDLKVASQKAAKAYSDGKVADNLTASTTVAPSKTAVNTGLALKANIASPTFTGTTALQGLLDLTNASAGQIGFPASQNASAGANVLDDYEEGTWTAGVSFGGGTTGITYSNQEGLYTKIGRLVHVNGLIVLTSKGSSTGAAKITGLPFTVANLTQNYSMCSIRIYATNAIGVPTGTVLANDTKVQLDHLATSGTESNMTDATFTNITVIRFSASYYV